MNEYKAKFLEWYENPMLNEEDKKELQRIENDEEEIKDRFYKNLEFGTGGLRGIIGMGTNRMNIYTVRQATQGLANYIKNCKGENKGAVIAYDSRRMSSEFAKEAALCLNANGIKTYLFESLRPTPELSFAVRKLGCISGIVITASHNPRDYNGYKVYWEDGAQITPPHDKNILSEVAKIKEFSQVKVMEEDDARARGLFKILGTDFDDLYVEELKKQSIHPEIIRKIAKDIKIVYTPLHGTGNVPVRRILRELGFEQVYVVEEQKCPDGNFPTVAYPNPEDENAWKLALKLAERVEADLVLATDPDADRLGVYAKDSKTGKYISFSGNMSGMLIAEYILSSKAEKREVPDNGALVDTIVTTDMAKEIAKAYNVKLIEVLTGFKYIGEQIKKFEEENTYNYIFGLEESYGCLAGTYARDKDAIVAVMLLCDAAAYYKYKGLTLVDQMEILYQKYGYFKEDLKTFTLMGSEGVEKIENIIGKLRSNTPDQIGGFKVKVCRDYKIGKCYNLITEEVRETGLPKSNVLYFELENNGWFCVRPSGTEPKIKFYYGVKGDSNDEAESLLSGISEEIMRLMEI